MSRQAVLAAILISSAAGHARANLLVNPGFETGDFSGWSVDGSRTPAFGVGTDGTPIPGGAGAYTVIVQSGSYAAFADVAALDQSFPATGRYLGLSQTVNVQAGVYDVGFSRGTRGSVTNGLGGTHNEVVINGAPSFFEQGEIPEGAYSTVQNLVTLTDGPTLFDFHVSGSGSGLAGVSFDNFFVNAVTLTPVPEPASIGLLATAMAALLKLRLWPAWRDRRQPIG